MTPCPHLTGTASCSVCEELEHARAELEELRVEVAEMRAQMNPSLFGAVK